MRRSSTLVLALLLAASPSQARREGHEWYDHYESAREALDAADYQAALDSLDRAVALRPEAGRLRTYGSTFTLYLPEAVRALALFGLGRDEEAARWAERAESGGLLDREPSLAARLRTEVEAARLRAERASPTEDADTAKGPQAVAAMSEPAARGGAPPIQPAETARADATAAAGRDVGSAPSPLTGEGEAMPPARAAAGEADPATRRGSGSPDPAADGTSLVVRGDARGTEAVLLLREGLRDFLSGELDGAERRLAEAAGALPRSGGAQAVLGALRYTRFLLDGERDAALETQAAEDFRRALRLDPGVSLDERYFSPRVRAFLEGLRVAKR